MRAVPFGLCMLRIRITWVIARLIIMKPHAAARHVRVDANLTYPTLNLQRNLFRMGRLDAGIFFRVIKQAASADGEQ